MWIKNLPTSAGGSTTIVIGTTEVSGGTQGSVLFVGAASVIQQDNANFFWDDTNNFLGLGTATPDGRLHLIQPAAATAAIFIDPADASTSPAISFRTQAEAALAIVGVARSANQGVTGSAAGDLYFGLQTADSSFIFAPALAQTTSAPEIELREAGVVVAPIRLINRADVASFTRFSFNLNSAGTRDTGGLGAWQLHFDTGIDTLTLNLITAAGVTGAGLSMASALFTLTDSGGSIGTLSSTGVNFVVPLIGVAGTAAAPQYSFSTSTGMGMYRSGADILGFSTAGAARMTIDATGDFTLTQGISTTGSPIGFRFNGGAHTALTASAEANDVYYDLSRTVQFSTGALTTQRAYFIDNPTYGFVGASTLTNPVTFEIGSAPAAGTNATFTSPRAARFGSADVSLGPTTAGFNYAVIDLPAHTVTVTGTTTITSANPVAGIKIGVITITDSSAVTLNNPLAALYIAGAPAGAGSVVVTRSYAIFVDDGNVRFDGTMYLDRGGVTAPAYSFHSSGTQDTNTGMYSPAADGVALAANGVQRFHGNATGIGFNAATPIAQPDYTITNPSTSRSLDVGAADAAAIRAVLGTLLQDLIDYGLLQ